MTMVDNKQVTVVLAGNEYVLQRIPMIKLRTIGPKMTAILADVTGDLIKKGKNDEIKSAFDLLMDKFLEIPYELIHLFVPTAPKEIFEDEDHGVTFPEFYDALKKALEYNRLDVLQGFFTKAAASLVTKKR